ncbi:MAG: SpoIID/LytB domain-containing protein [Clostridia bacterium]|nr:SpoIID/LytB domain-containing protein [Clostridia bacterium]
MRKFTLVSIILLILVVIFSIIGFASVENLEIIKIGLIYGNEDGTNVLNTVDTAFEFGEIVNDNYVTHAQFPNIKSFYFVKDDSAHVKLTGYADYASAIQIISQYNLTNYFVVKDQGFSIYSPAMSNDQINQAMSSLSQMGLATAKAEPNANLVMLFSGQVFFGYDASLGEFLVAPINQQLMGNPFSFNGKLYRGGIGAKRQNTQSLTLINYVRMNEYLYGVLPKEMSKDWPIEALKAQAVVARNFAITNQNKFNNYGFNLDDTVNSQVYGGYSVEGPISNQAVEETKNVVLKYDDMMVNGYYHSNSGGYTENSENVWSQALPYIKGVYDPFSLGAPNDEWSVSYSRSDIERTLNDQGYKIGTLKDFIVSDYTQNNRVYNARITGTAGVVDLEKQKIRGVFGYNTIKSTLISIIPDNSVVLTDGKEFVQSGPSQLTVLSGDNTITTVSNTFVVKSSSTEKNIPLVATSYTVSGKGWGHGLGMSQWGAKSMADQGFSFEDILTFYYTGTHIEQE